MLISQLARMVGVDTQTIRFYERQGLLPPPDRQENGYRIYTEKHTEQLAFVRHCRVLDLSLSEISDVRSRITALLELEEQLISLRKRCNDDREVETCGVLAGISEADF
jgi:DNA-binding transcriptional MerR regulator